eukprot:CAMPEP_0176335368 /NCGR_PEP_ID=MMETSP0121_2-20121125/78579_1 /TAXON_ID=160619 /ORGANISM="Kryptoperidinium foliaceum, Strain CCMP 1326" /LENGTH=305 /DNA_ID=CAMNT_0017678341 /DNA_START=6 /DNA_END=923 /DNA_ORIENTATION=-
MVFVNQIGEIVHGCVDDYHGAPNKNIGDCFLLVWRISGVDPERQTKLADMAIMSFVRIVAEINKSRVLAVYRDHPGLLQRIRNYRVQMGFGLHCGWAIEGAIGSEFKIDASYLSPNVNIASSLERAATGIYRVSVLVSDVVVGLCGVDLASQLRLVDRVVLPGSKRPLELFVLDLDTSALEVDEPMRAIPWNTKKRYEARQILEADKRRMWTREQPLFRAFESMPDVRAMRRRFTNEFFQVFIMGYRNYAEGEWLVARALLEKSTRALGLQDGPSTALLCFMEAQGFQAPHDWQGVHELSSDSHH